MTLRRLFTRKGLSFVAMTIMLMTIFGLLFWLPGKGGQSITVVSAAPPTITGNWQDELATDPWQSKMPMINDNGFSLDHFRYDRRFPNVQLQPMLGTYPNATVITGGNTTIMPNVPPNNVTSIVAATSTSFKGTLTVSPTTGVVAVTNAYVGGTYTVTVTAFGNDGGTVTKTFTLTVNNPANCSPVSFMFGQPTGSPIASSSGMMVVGDFNGDGRQDLAGPNETVLLGNGSGGFNVTPVNQAGGAAVGSDFNGDGKQDLAYANGNILLGNGSGGFSSAVGSPLSVGTSPRSIGVGDFNSDAKQDLMIANNGANNVTIWLGNGGGGFSQAVGSPISIEAYTHSAVVGEFNGDGKQDIAVAYYSGDNNITNVRTLLGNGSGGFSVGTNTPAGMGNNPLLMAVSDFNADGTQDLAVANEIGNNVTILLGSGTGAFFQAVGSPATVDVSPQAVAVADFNGDGKPDLAVTNSDSDNLTILQGNGSGVFTQAFAHINVGSQPRFPVVGDFNADGKQDLAVATGAGMNILLNNCKPAITAAAVSRLQGSPVANMTVATVSDAEQAANTLAVKVNDGASATVNGVTVSGISISAGGVVTANVALTCTATNASFTLTVTDSLNATAQATLTVTVAANTGPTLTYGNPLVAPGGSLTITPTNGPSDNGSIASIALQNQGTYTGTISVSSSGVVSIGNAAPFGAHTIMIRATDNCGAITDVTFTLHVAILTLGNYPNAIVVTGGNTTVTPTAAPVNAVSITAATSTNFKGTFTVNPGTGVVKVTNAHVAGTYVVTVTAFNSTGGTVTKTFMLTVNNPVACAAGLGFSATPVGTGTLPDSVALGDFNSDGLQDLATANLNSSNVTILLGNGSGGFNQPPGSPIAVGSNPYSVVVSDFNGDGKQDFAVVNATIPGTVTIFLGNGGGGFTSAPGSPVSVGNNPLSMAVGDFSGDGKSDLAVGNANSNNVTILLGNGNGGFSLAAGSPVSGVTQPQAEVVGDFNSDGKQDLAVVNTGSNNLTILLGNGSGGFSPAAGSPISVGTFPDAVVSGDFNGDGNQDLAVGNVSSTDVAILLGNGSGGFSPASGSPIVVGISVRALALGDFNSDAKQDVTVMGSGAGGNVILLGNGSGGFSQATGLLNSGDIAVAVGDFNGDGKQDLAGANQVTNNVTILLSNCAPTITASAVLTRQQGSAGSSSTIATVSDAETAAGSLTVAVTNVPTGLTITGLTNITGAITANVAAACNATVGANTVLLTVTDGGGLMATTNLTVNVTANTAPVLTYANQSVTFGNALTINLANGPSDNGTINNILVQSQGTYTGTISVNNVTGVVSLSNAAPSGTHTITIRATDNCGAFTDATIALTVNQIIPTLGNYPNANVITGGNTTVTPVAAPTNTTSITAATSTNFKGTVAVNPATGVVTVTNAHVAGPYTVMVTASNASGGTATKTFMLTVSNPTNCSPASFAFSQPPGSPVSAGNRPSSLAVGDFNGDGKQDLAMGNNNPSAITILMGNDGGSFVQPAGSPIGMSAVPNSIGVRDFNGDGRLDLVVGNYGSGLTILLGNGNGGFSPTPNSPVNVGSITGVIAVGDFNSDGKYDLAMPTRGSIRNNVKILLGDGNGGFISMGSAGIGTILQSVAVGDFNGDGKQDLVVTDSDDNSKILIGDGSGGFSTGSLLDVPVDDTGMPVAVGDFNGDFKQDLAVASKGFLTILLGDGSGSFSRTTASPFAAGSVVTSLAIGDFNADGKQDISMASPLYNAVVLLGNGMGSFSPAVSLPSSGNSIASIVVADFNADGKQDLATANSTVTILLNNCAPIIAASAALSRQQGSANTVSTVATVSDTETTASNLTVTATTIPTGLTITGLTNTNGTINATVAAACNAAVGANTVVLTVTDSGGLTATANLTVNVTVNTALVLTYSSQSVTAGNALTINPATGPSDNGSVSTIAVQNQGSYTGTISVNNSTGVISLSNAKPGGTHTITLRATDNCGVTTDASFTLTVNCVSTIGFSPPTLPNATVGAAYSQTLSASGGVGPYSFALMTGALPTGLSLAASGELTGTPTVAGAFNFTVKATDAVGCSGMQAYTLNVQYVLAGAVNYCITPSKPVAGVTLTATGTPAQTVTSGANGSYTLTLSSVPYTVTPAKAGEINGISAFDAALITRQLSVPTTLNACQRLAGDANNDGNLTLTDAQLIGEYVVGKTNTSIVTNWKFTPVNRAYLPQTSNLNGQNYDAALLGEVSGNWLPPSALAVTGITPLASGKTGIGTSLRVSGGNFQPGLKVILVFPDGVEALLSEAQVREVTAQSFVLTLPRGLNQPMQARILNPDGSQSQPFTLRQEQ